MLYPLLQEVDVMAEERLVYSTDRQGPERVQVRNLLDAVHASSLDCLGPPYSAIQEHRPKRVGNIEERVRRRDDRNQALQVTVVLPRRGPLYKSEVRGADHSDVPAAPSLSGAPLQRIAAVVRLVDERPPLALRVELPPDVLGYEYIAATRVERAFKSVAAPITGPLEDNRKLAGGIGTVDVRRK